MHRKPEVVDEAKTLVLRVLNIGPRPLSPGATKEAAESIVEPLAGCELEMWHQRIRTTRG